MLNYLIRLLPVENKYSESVRLNMKKDIFAKL